jgi:hypothetical protein
LCRSWWRSPSKAGGGAGDSFSNPCRRAHAPISPPSTMEAAYCSRRIGCHRDRGIGLARLPKPEGKGKFRRYPTSGERFHFRRHVPMKALCTPPRSRCRESYASTRCAPRSRQPLPVTGRAHICSLDRSRDAVTDTRRTRVTSQRLSLLERSTAHYATLGLGL